MAGTRAPGQQLVRRLLFRTRLLLRQALQARLHLRQVLQARLRLRLTRLRRARPRRAPCRPHRRHVVYARIPQAAIPLVHKNIQGTIVSISQMQEINLVYGRPLIVRRRCRRCRRRCRRCRRWNFKRCSPLRSRLQTVRRFQLCARETRFTESFLDNSQTFHATQERFGQRTCRALSPILPPTALLCGAQITRRKGVDLHLFLPPGRALQQIT